MKRITLLVLATAVLGIWVAPAWANHSQSTGVNCPNFQFQEDAQAYFDLHPGDPEGLDGPIGPGFEGIEGVACETLPRRGTQATTTTTVVVTTTTEVPASGRSPSAGNSGAASDASAGTTTTTVQPTTTTTTTAEVHGRVATINAAPATASQGRVLALTG